MSVKRNLAFEIPLVGLLGIAVLGSTLAITRRSGDYKFFDELIEVKSIISRQYVEEADEKKLKEGAIKGMVDALSDPYTIYVPPAEKREFNKDLTGEYVGIGAQVNTQTGYLVIVSPLEDSPAFRAGLMADDKVLEIEGKTTKDLTVEQCVELLSGQPGTKVNLLIERKGEKLPIIEITRDRIKTRSIKGYHRDDKDAEQWKFLIDPENKIAYVRMTQFTPNVANELFNALRSVGADRGELKGLVLDLRYNPGGLLSEAEAIADLFLPEGVIVSTRGRAFPERVSRAEKDGTLPDFPMAVLLNGQSASASEVLAGALVENNRAIVVGSRSFGKGSVQSVLEVPGGNGSELKITEQGYYLPSGRSITRKDTSPTWGVDPTEGFYVPITDKEVIAMFEVRRKQEVLTAAGGQPGTDEKWDDSAWVLDRLKDKQLTAAVDAIRGKISSGQWQATGEKGVESGVISGDELRLSREYRERLLRELERTETRIEAIESGTKVAKKPDTTDLWDDTIDLTDGHLEVRDKDGKVIAAFRITGNRLERWLFDADLEKQ
ncbi:MAG: S41 family peptidase [Phycisphaerales bacterium]